MRSYGRGWPKWKAWLVVVWAPLGLLWTAALMWEQTPGARAQDLKITSPTTKSASTTHPGTTYMPSTSPTNTLPRPTMPTPTRTDPPGTEPTFPNTTKVPIITFPNPPDPTRPPGSGDGMNPTSPTREDCYEPPGVTGVTWRCGGATWICHDKISTPGTYCIDP